MSRLSPERASHVAPLTFDEEVGANFFASPSSDGMATHTAHPAGTSRTLKLLEEIAGGTRSVQLRAQVAAANRGSTPEQVEEAFQEACLKAARGCRGQTMGEVYVWLRKTTGTVLKDSRERLKREVLVDHSAPEFAVADVSIQPPDEVVIKREEHDELDALTVAILDRLCERERTIAILHSNGYQRKEIADRLGLTTRVVKRSVEEVLATGRSQLTKFTGYGCADGHQLVSRYAFGLAVGREAQKAQLHLATCSRCGSMYERLDVWRERVAVLLPVPPVVADQHAAIERVVQTGTDVITSGNRPRTGLRRHLADAAREHLAGASARTVDPTPLAGMRPGAVAAAVAGCIAIGGGATYCVKESVGPFVGFASKPMTERAAPERTTPKRVRAKAPAQATAAVVPATAVRTAPSKTATTPARTKRAKPKPLPPAPEDEFEPTSAGGSSTSPITASAASTSSTGSSPQSSSPQQRPAAAPAEGPGEFDGP